MTKKPSPPAKVPVRFPGRPYAELVDPEFAAEIARMRQEESDRIIRNLKLEKLERVIRNLKLARTELLSLQQRREIHRAARRKLGLE